MKMSPEYMAELHKFKYRSNDSDINRLILAVSAHLKFIPHKKLYRYRKCSERELLTLEKGAVWLSDPRSFPDMFDATMPMENMDYLDFEYSFYCTQELAYKALQRVADKDGEPIPNKESFFEAMYKTMEEYDTQEKIEEKLIEIFGEDEYRKMRSKQLPTIDFSKPVERTKKLLSGLIKYPRDSLAIASFTTRYDNRNMWENYAGNYTGFCVEYDFSCVVKNLNSKNAWDVLCLFPVKYYHKRPLFDYTSILQDIINADVNQSEFDLDIDDFFAQYYRAITAKLYDYRAEQEWRLVMMKNNLGEYKFPYAKKVYIGKDMPDDGVQRIREISAKLNIPVYAQAISKDQNGFEYKLLL